MKRKIYDKLLEWKNNKTIMPLMLLGARQVGKTYILDEFCKNEFENYIYINLFERQDIVDLYKMRITSEDKFLKLKGYLGIDIEKENTILFIDEIQESEELIAELKYFCEKHNSIRIVTAGSLLGIKLKRSHFSFPVGKVFMLTMYPMDFEEFLLAFDQQFLISEIRKCYNSNKELELSLHEKALYYYRLYLCYGGMPASVWQIVLAKADITKCDNLLLKNIVQSYFNDMDKYVTNNAETLKIERVYSSIPSQLSNESNKFQYSKIVSGARAREYELAIDWLEASNLILKSFQVSKPEIPLKGFVKNEFFKIFLSDVGILSSTLNINAVDIMTDNLSLYKGALTENYVANQFVASHYDLFYWVSDGIAEVDFLLYTKDGIVPVEVKAGDTTKSKSLKIYTEKYQPKYTIRISMKNFGLNNGIKSVPLYAVFCIIE